MYTHKHQYFSRRDAEPAKKIFYILLKQSFSTLRALRLCESLLFVDGH